MFFLVDVQARNHTNLKQKRVCSVWELWNSNGNMEFHWLHEVVQTFNLCIFYSFEMQYSLPRQNLLHLSGSIFRTGVQPLTEIMQLRVQMTEVNKTMTDVSQQRLEANSMQWLGGETKQMDILFHSVSN